LIISHLTDSASPFRDPVSAVIDAIDSVEGPGDEEVSDALPAALTAARSDTPPSPDAFQELSAGWVAEEALAIAVYCVLSYPDDFAAAVRLAANHSGDSDSTAAIAGNIAVQTGTGRRVWWTLELAAGAPKRSKPRGSRCPANADIPAQWKREREDAATRRGRLPRSRRRLAAPRPIHASHLTTSVERSK